MKDLQKAAQKPEVVCIGQVVVDCIIKGWNMEDASRRREAESITLSSGGDAFNESVVFSRLGHRTMLLSGLGQDGPGDMLKAELKKNHILLSPQPDHEIQTTLACLIVKENGDRTSLLTPLHVTRQFEIDTDLLKGTRLVSLASLFRAPLMEPDILLSICKAAKETGAILSADTKISRGGRPTFEELKPIMPYLDYIFPNIEEAAFYTGKTEVKEMAEVFLDAGVGHVLIKMGKEGSYIRDREEEFIQPSLPVEAVDATGAGDNFAAGVLSSILRGSSLMEAVQFGTCCAAACVQSIGASSGVRSRDQIETMYKEYRDALSPC